MTTHRVALGRRVSMSLLGIAVIMPVTIAAEGCSHSMPTSGLTSPVSPTSIGLNGQYRGELTITEGDTTCKDCWPAHMILMARLQQSGTEVTGGFNNLTVDFSGGNVKGTVSTATQDTFGIFKARFEPNDLGTLIVFDTKITSPDGGTLVGSFELGDPPFDRGNVTFTRIG